MKCKSLICAVAFGLLAFGGADAGGEKNIAPTNLESKAPGKLIQVDTGNTPIVITSGVWKKLVRIGEIVELSVYCNTTKEENLRTFKIEIKGDSVSVAGPVVEAPVWLDPKKKIPGRDPVIDKTKRQFCCYLIPTKVGDTVVKVTPVGMDGNDRAVRELVLHVPMLPAPRKKMR